MTEIIKTSGFVLRKIDYGDTSKIISVFSKDFGKISGILKGAKSAKSNKGGLTDLINHIELVLYKKSNRDLHAVTQVHLINNFRDIKENLEKLKYASAVLELVQKLTLENEVHPRLYTGIEKILKLISQESFEKELFTKFLMFFINEIGFGINLTECNDCRVNIESDNRYYFDFERGFLCGKCKISTYNTVEISKELFKMFVCLSSKQNQKHVNIETLEKIISLIEKYIKFHIDEFDGIKSLKML